MKKGFIFIIVTTGIWYCLTESGAISALYLPHPMDVIKAFRQQLFAGVIATLGRTVLGMMLGILLAWVIHFISLYSKLINVIDSQIAASRAIPVIAILPLFLVWFGFNEIGRILIVTLSAMLYFLAPLHNAYRLLPRAWTILYEQNRLNYLVYYFRIVVPGTVASLLGAIRLTFSISFTMAIASEYMGAQIGIGKIIDSARVTFNVPGIFSAIIIASTVGFIIDWLIVRLFCKLIHWQGSEGKK